MKTRIIAFLVASACAALGAQAALADQAPINITITDAGFDQPTYNIVTSQTNPAIINIVNRGSVVHTASRVPGSAPFKVGFGTINFFAGQTTNLTDFDSGGLAPNQNVTYAVPYPGSYQITSATDCLNGNKSPRFNCAPVTLNVTNTPASPVAGAAIDQSSLTCVKTIQAPNVPELCLTQSRTPGQTLGSPTAGVGNTTVVIDEQGGFHPSVIFLKPGSTITWVNNGQQPHDAVQANGTAAPDGFHVLDSGLLQPGASYSYTYTCPPGPTSANTGQQLTGCTDLVGPFMYWSNVGTDIIPPSADGFGTTTTRSYTNSSLYIGAVYLTAQ